MGVKVLGLWFGAVACGGGSSGRICGVDTLLCCRPGCGMGVVPVVRAVALPTVIVVVACSRRNRRECSLCSSTAAAVRQREATNKEATRVHVPPRCRQRTTKLRCTAPPGWLVFKAPPVCVDFVVFHSACFTTVVMILFSIGYGAAGSHVLPRV